MHKNWGQKEDAVTNTCLFGHARADKKEQLQSEPNFGCVLTMSFMGSHFQRCGENNAMSCSQGQTHCAADLEETRNQRTQICFNHFWKLAGIHTKGKKSNQP